MATHLNAKEMKNSRRIPSSAEKLEYDMKGIIRGPNNIRKISIIFTAHDELEGMNSILNSLEATKTKASFFLGGAFFKKENFPFFQRILNGKHYVGPHSDTHATFADEEGKTLVDFDFFKKDLGRNVARIKQWGYPEPKIKYWIPANEQYSNDISDWSKSIGLTLFNYTPGLKTNADYISENERGFLSSEKIIKGALKVADTNGGLSGFIILIHVGVGPSRKDKLYSHLTEFIGALKKRNYQLVTVDELFEQH